MFCTSVVLECDKTIPLKFLQPHALLITQSNFVIKQFFVMSLKCCNAE